MHVNSRIPHQVVRAHQYLLWATMGQPVFCDKPDIPSGNTSVIAVQFLTPFDWPL